MLHLHFNLNLSGSGDGPEYVSLGDGKLLGLIVKWAPTILAALGIKVPPLVDLITSQLADAVEVLPADKSKITIKK